METEMKEGAVVEGSVVKKPTFAESMYGHAAAAGLEGFAVKRDQAELAESVIPETKGAIWIERGLLRESPTNPRKRWGDLEELSQSMAKVGQLQPLIVIADPDKPVPEGGHPYSYVIVSGHRRFRAGKQAGFAEFRCEVRQLTPDQIFEIQVVENVQRKDLHPMEEAEGYDQMLKAGWEVPTIAERIRKSTGWIYSRLKLLELGPEGRAAFFEERIELSVALVLGRQPHANQGKALLGLERIATVKEQIHYLQTEFARNLKGSPFDLRDGTLLRKIGGGEPTPGDCVTCPMNSNNAPRELFNDYEKIERAGICSNTPCWYGKCDQTVSRTAEKARARGEKVLTATEAKKVISYGAPVHGSPYVIASDIVPEDPKRRSWQQILEGLDKDDRPEVVIAPNDQKPGEMFRLFDRKAAVAAAGKAGAKWAKKQAPEEKQVKLSKAKAEKGHDRARLTATVTELALPALAASLRKAVTLTDLRPLALYLFEPLGAEDVELLAGAFECKSLEKWIRSDATIKDLIAFAVIAGQLPVFQGGGETFDPGFAAMAREHKIDLQAMTRAQLAIAKGGAIKWKEEVPGGNVTGIATGKNGTRLYGVSYNGGAFYWSGPGKKGGDCKSIAAGKAKCEELEAAR